MEQIYNNSTQDRPFTRDHFGPSKTQILSFNELNKGNTRVTQKEKVLEIIGKLQPIHIRGIARETGLEIAAVCRTIKDLEQNLPPLIKIGLVKESPDTNRRVQFYVLQDWEEKSEAA